ncbi:hypothetical protein MPDQ_005398 [Monascus purpureus]|uniref:Monooxygenase n=1 Tax=Monascus purpureus TaxID=5098 RepID=A0A507R006_MONPU|nr:hypothetical protein MPDQ_005398 [Monascus purpureus]
MGPGLPLKMLCFPSSLISFFTSGFTYLETVLNPVLLLVPDYQHISTSVIMASPAVNGDASKCRQKPVHANRKLRVITIGAGASGIYMAYKLKYYFTDFVLDVYEKNPDLGGTWFENRYQDVPA